MGKEKKEIGKLLELLNEYHHFNSDLIYYGWDEEYEKFYFHTELPEEQKKKLGDALIDDGIDEQRVCNEWICSKKFGFIKWLVENDKIDTDPIRTRVKRVYIELEPREFTPQDFTDRVIMLLSISNSPIEDLLLYLK